MRLASRTGSRREARSSGDDDELAVPCARTGWPPQPVVWQIWEEGELYGVELEEEKEKHTILYMGTEPYEKATVPRMMLRV